MRAVSKPSLDDVRARLDEVIKELGRPPTRAERKNGWIEETRIAVAAYLKAVSSDIEDELPPHPSELPSQVEIVKWLDAMGVAMGDPLNERVMEAFAAARRFAKRSA